MKSLQKIKDSIKLLKADPVLFASFILAFFSCFFVKPTTEYFSYIDYGVICILYSLMVVVAGLKKAGGFESVINTILKKVSNTRGLSFVLVFACFFSSMFITNDVALITFVPLTIMIFGGEETERFLIPVIVLETVAANLGSMLTPIGNPQNLYIYSYFKLSLAEFLKIMVIPTVISILLIAAGIFFIGKERIETKEKTTSLDVKKTLVWILMFLVCIMSVVHILPYWAALLVVITVGFVLDRKILLSADFALLITFIFFFIFIGNMKNIPDVSSFLQGIINGRELPCGILLSQVVSNVPATMLMSGFTDDYKELLVGVNLGGLGTLIASMASLISYKMYAKIKNAKIGKYVFVFTLVNIAFLVILWLTYILFF